MIRAETWARAIDKRGRLGKGNRSSEDCAMDVWATLRGTEKDKNTLLFLYHRTFMRSVAKDNDDFQGSSEERAAYMSRRIRQLSYEVLRD